MRTLATVHLNGNFWTRHSAKATPLAFSLFLLRLFFDKLNRPISFLVHLIRRGNQLLGTDGDTELAILAQFRVDFNVGGDHGPSLGCLKILLTPKNKFIIKLNSLKINLTQ